MTDFRDGIRYAAKQLRTWAEEARKEMPSEHGREYTLTDAAQRLERIRVPEKHADLFEGA